MTSRLTKPLAVAACLAVFAAALAVGRTGLPSADPAGEGPVAHWAFDKVAGNEVADQAGSLPGTLLGTPKPADAALELHGRDDGVLVWEKRPPRPDALPREALS